MVHDIIEICRSYPQIMVFLAIAIGYFVGKIKFHGFNIGSTAGVLIIALVLGQMNIKVSPLLKTVSFALFIFCMGYKVGPQFFGALKKEGLNYIWLSLLVALSGLVIAILLGKVFGFDKGITAGLLAGSMTQSSVIGTAEGAIKHLSISTAEQTALEGNVAVAYAITYLFGTGGLIFFFKMLPRLMKIDLRNEARKLEEEMSGNSGEIDNKPELFSWYKQLNLCAYRVTNEKILGKTVSELEALFSRKVAVEKLKRADRVIDPTPGTIIQSGDVVAIVGDRSEFLKADVEIGPEVDDRGVVGLIGEILSICVLNRQAVGKTLGEISTEHGHGCFLRRITRQGHELPLTKNTVVHKCDVLQVAGAQKDVEKLVKHLGYPERPTVITDLVIVGLGCVLGTLLGLIMVPVLGYTVPFAFGNVLLTIWGTVLVNVM